MGRSFSDRSARLAGCRPQNGAVEGATGAHQHGRGRPGKPIQVQYRRDGRWRTVGGWPYAVRRVEGRQDTRVHPLGRSPASGSAVRSGERAAAGDYGGLHAAAQALGDEFAHARARAVWRGALSHRGHRRNIAGLRPPAEGNSEDSVHCRGRPGGRRVERLRHCHRLWLDRRICVADRGVVRRHSGDARARSLGAQCAERIVRVGRRGRNPRMANPPWGITRHDRKTTDRRNKARGTAGPALQRRLSHPSLHDVEWRMARRYQSGGHELCERSRTPAEFGCRGLFPRRGGSVGGWALESSRFATADRRGDPDGNRCSRRNLCGEFSWCRRRSWRYVRR